MSPQLRVLIVEDDNHARDALATLLRDEGYRVDTAEDGRSALERIDRASPDLIVTDISMPGMDGLELLRRLPRDIPVVVVTAFEDVGDQALALGAWFSLPKPLELEKLLAIADLVEPGGVPAPPAARAAGG